MALPTSDVATTGWTPSTPGSIFGVIDDPTLDTGDYAWANVADVAGTVTPVVGFADTWPAGIHTLRMHVDVTSGSTSVIVFELFDSRPFQPATKLLAAGYFAAKATASAATTSRPPAGIVVAAGRVKEMPLVNEKPETLAATAPVL